MKNWQTKGGWIATGYYVENENDIVPDLQISVENADVTKSSKLEIAQRIAVLLNRFQGIDTHAIETTSPVALTRNKKLELLSNWQAQYQAAEAYTQHLTSLFGECQESKAYETLWKLFDNHTHVLRILLGDDTPSKPAVPWMHWYCYDNDMGARGLTAGIKGWLKPITTLEDLLGLIEGSHHG